MKTLKLDKNNNLVFDYNLRLVDEQDAIKQDIKNLLLMFYTEYPFNILKGINWYEVCSFNDKNSIKNIVSERILQDKRVKSIESIDIEIKQGSLRLDIVLITDKGRINV